MENVTRSRVPNSQMEYVSVRIFQVTQLVLSLLVLDFRSPVLIKLRV